MASRLSEDSVLIFGRFTATFHEGWVKIVSADNHDPEGIGFSDHQESDLFDLRLLLEVLELCGWTRP